MWDAKQFPIEHLSEDIGGIDNKSCTLIVTFRPSSLIAVRLTQGGIISDRRAPGALLKVYEPFRNYLNP